MIARFADGTIYWQADQDIDFKAAQPEVWRPEVPPPVWDERRIDPSACMDAVRAMCS